MHARGRGKAGRGQAGRPSQRLTGHGSGTASGAAGPISQVQYMFGKWSSLPCPSASANVKCRDATRATAPLCFAHSQTKDPTLSGVLYRCENSWTQPSLTAKSTTTRLLCCNASAALKLPAGSVWLKFASFLMPSTSVIHPVAILLESANVHSVRLSPQLFILACRQVYTEKTARSNESHVQCCTSSPNQSWSIHF